MSEQEALYGVEELAERAGVSRRTVRYYVQRGLLPPPTGVGRGKHYTEQHLATLLRIRDQQAAGVLLEQMLPSAARPSADEARTISPEQSVWTRIVIADGVELHLRDRRLSEPRLEQLAGALQRLIEGEQP